MKLRSGKTSRLLWVNNAWCIHLSMAGYTCQHLHQRIEERKGSAIGNHLREQHDMEPEDIAQNFRTLRKCQQIWLSYFWNVFYKRTETNVKQTVRFNSRQTIRVEQFLGR